MSPAFNTSHFRFGDEKPQHDVYYNPHLDPKRFLDGPLSLNPATLLRQSQCFNARSGIVVIKMCNICDGISTRCALEAGFSDYSISFRLARSFHCCPKRLCSGDIVANDISYPAAEMVWGLGPTAPVIAGVDIGFGKPGIVARTVAQYARAGVAALHIEDQVQTKKCGHLLGKQVVSHEEYFTRVRAAVLACDSIPEGSDFPLCYYCSNRFCLNVGDGRAVIRLKLTADVGADVGAEGVKTKELLESTFLVNVISGGLTLSFTSEEAEKMGAKIIIFSLVSSVAMVCACRAAMISLKLTGTGLPTSRRIDLKQFFEVMVIGLNEVVGFDARAGGSSFQVI
ncbi:LOW QUALITY PROTEIN: hypothetical protein CVT25_006305 [Psilocybe cyanescens]|uniref:methylisocitrate lyase n=1 Tax=Psilocybe cyanescens TaxID=93625 RepID=A0A409WYN6_PSICY|nr:LOW QUALITY PROTEIN: hypothetical protein CVT25_006305 [Psilocybe cyanescens]